MNSKAVASAFMAMSLATAGLALAQGDSRFPPWDPMGRGNVEGAQPGDWIDCRDSLGRRLNRRGYQGREYYDPRRDERGAGPYYGFRRGDCLPVEYRHRNYVVDNWRGHNLSAPPPGYTWIQAGGDYFLVAITSGIIAQVLRNN